MQQNYPHMTNEVTIREIIDTHLQTLVDIGLNRIVGEVAPEMAGNGTEADEDEEGWNAWLPVNSTVTDEEIASLEKQLGHRLPPDYITFLKHKHFYELYISEASFCPHPVDTWKKQLTDLVFEGHPKEFHIDKGFIPFAVWSDWGLLCFDTTAGAANNDHPIVLWDHDSPNEIETVADNFVQLMIEMDADEEITDEDMEAQDEA
jgi:hypothetical protein